MNKLRDEYDFLRRSNDSAAGNHAHAIGALLEAEGLHEKAIAWHRRDVEHQRRAGNALDEVEAHHRLGVCLLEVEKFDDALVEFKEQLRRADRVGSQHRARKLQEAHVNLGRAYQSHALYLKEHDGDVADAGAERCDTCLCAASIRKERQAEQAVNLSIEHFERSLREADSLRDLKLRADARLNLAWALHDAEKNVDAAAHFSAAIDLLAKQGTRLADGCSSPRPLAGHALGQLRLMSGLAVVLMGAGALRVTDVRLSPFSAEHWLRIELAGCRALDGSECSAEERAQAIAHSLRNQLKLHLELLDTRAKETCRELRELLRTCRDHISAGAADELRSLIGDLIRDALELVESCSSLDASALPDGASQAALDELQARAAELSEGAEEHELLRRRPDYRNTFGQLERRLAELADADPGCAELPAELAAAQEQLALALESVREFAGACGARERCVASLRKQGGARARLADALIDLGTCLEKAGRPPTEVCAAYKSALEAAESDAQRLRALDYLEVSLSQSADGKAAAAEVWRRLEACEASHKRSCAHAQRAAERAREQARAQARPARGEPAERARKPVQPSAERAAQPAAAPSEEGPLASTLPSPPGTPSASPLPPTPEPAAPPRLPSELARAAQSGRLVVSSAMAEDTMAVLRALSCLALAEQPPAPAGPPLRALCLSESLLCSDALRCLRDAARRGLFDAVTELELGGNWLSGQEGSVEELCARCGRADGGLRALGLERCSLARLPRAAEEGAMRHLRVLCVSFNALRGDGRLGLLEQEPLAQVAVLSLRGCALGARDVERIAHTLGPSAGALLSLDLSQSQLGSQGVDALAALVRKCTKLHTLTLDWCALELGASSSLYAASQLVHSRVSLVGSAVPTP